VSIRLTQGQYGTVAQSGSSTSLKRKGSVVQIHFVPQLKGDSPLFTVPPPISSTSKLKYFGSRCIYYKIFNMKKKFCNKCKKDKSVDDFHKNPTKKDGLQSMCKECRKNYHREHYLKNKEKYIKNTQNYKNIIIEWFINEKKKLKCKKCGENKFWLLDFHHRESKEKDIEISKLARIGSKKRLIEEMKKCDVLCSNCHRDLHYQENIASDA
jgi:hypothetical protein